MWRRSPGACLVVAATTIAVSGAALLTPPGEVEVAGVMLASATAEPTPDPTPSVQPTPTPAAPLDPTPPPSAEPTPPASPPPVCRDSYDPACGEFRWEP